ncbi:YeaC family protein [Photobacterium sp. DNB23_23_1]|uniref:DUF1315 family protein n=1 Tax=Photobacterium pectinilyticum TaxID=2906793 RepID=A0ABT1MVC5_9GAMM|nr:DUF1315 family protein [Photobacterium sp. ZSDE20]MCQ1056461.1 DUF1315 family protein [Photobacterium sp. ZSDE20]MDD1820596.1 DUF1315 family protein [Photobacterium sp. ZSDE20]
MDLETLLNAMTPEVYQRLATAVEIGKWPDGSSLTPEQRDSSMQAVMLYQSRHNADAAHMTVEKGGEIKFKSKAELKKEFAGDNASTAEMTADDIVRFDHDEL